MAALKMFELGKISSGKAAELAGMLRVEFLETCGRYRVSVFNYPDLLLASDSPGIALKVRNITKLKVNG
jgi:predicted HTH domain antitoxin